MVTIQASRTVTPIRSFFATGQAILPACAVASADRRDRKAPIYTTVTKDRQAKAPRQLRVRDLRCTPKGKKRWIIRQLAD
ncbi:MAG: hypothetical protein IIB44_04410 [Candidatus Marinimicrobia bacterium]|nr:hypothetical protein [Candidatus Neomarinimicrobiota bacterium]